MNEELFSEFLSSRALSPSTCNSYLRILNHAQKYLGDITQLTHKRFKSYMDESGFSGNYKYVFSETVRLFFRWWAGDNHPLSKMRFKRPVFVPQRTLTIEQVKKFLAFFDPLDAIDSRNKAIVLLGIDTGLRVSELCNLELKYLDLNKKRLQVIVKGGEWQTKIFSDFTAGSLKRWLSFRSELVGTKQIDYLFINLARYSHNYEIDIKSLTDGIRRLAEREGFQLKPMTSEKAGRLSALLNPGKPVHIRNAAILHLMACTGMSTFQLMFLRTIHLDQKLESIPVFKSNGGWKVKANLTEEAKIALRAWLNLRKNFICKGEEKIFLNAGSVSYKLTRSGLSLVLRRAAEKAGIGAFSPHDMRRTFAVLASMSGAPEQILMRAGGWHSTSMITVYTQGLKAENFREYLPVSFMANVK